MLISVENINEIGNVKIKMLKGERGDPGLSVTGAAINSSGHLIITMNDGNQIDAGNVADDIFWCTYDSTTYAEVTAAKNAGKLPIVYRWGANCLFIATSTFDYGSGTINAHVFKNFATTNNEVREVHLDNTNTWHSYNRTLLMSTNIQSSVSSSSVNTDVVGAKAVYDYLAAKEAKANKVTSISDQSTDTQYPSAKAVFDALSNNKEIFWCYRGESPTGTDTTGPEITAAVAAGKLPYLIYTLSNEPEYAPYCGPQLVNITGTDEIWHMFIGWSGKKLRRYYTRAAQVSAWGVQSYDLSSHPIVLFETELNGSTYTLSHSKTVADIFNAYDAGKVVQMRVGSITYDLILATKVSQLDQYSIKFSAVFPTVSGTALAVQYYWWNLVAGATTQLPSVVIKQAALT